MNKILLLFVCMVFSGGCATISKERREARETAASQSGLFCDFVNESDFRDVEVELNLRMANKCNSAKPFSVSGYKRLNESAGFMYCCSVKESQVQETPKASAPSSKNDVEGSAKPKENPAQGKQE
jgi:hypothetical protein